MKKFSLILALVMGIFASAYAQRQVTFENYECYLSLRIGRCKDAHHESKNK